MPCLLACFRFLLLWFGTLIIALVACPSLWAQSLVATGSQPFAVAVNPATNTIYVVNKGPNTVTVIDGATNTTRTVQVGRIPVAISINPVTNEAYIANSGDGTVTVINETQGSVRNISVGLNPQAIIVNPLTNKIYVASSDGNRTADVRERNGEVRVIDGSTDTVSPTPLPVGKNPSAIALNPVTNRIYVANDANGANATVNVIDGSSDSLLGSPIGVGNSPNALAVNPVTNRIYVISGNTLSVIDGVSNTVRATTPLLVSNLTAIAINPVTNFIYITSAQGIGTLLAVNGATDALAAIALIGNSPQALAVNSLTNRIYVTDNAPRGGHVVVIDGSASPLTRVNSIITGDGPLAVAVNPVTNRVYVANYADVRGTVAVVDGATRTTNTINAGSNPNAVAVNQVTNQVYVPNIGDNTVTVIDAANGNASSTVSAGTSPTAVAVNPATNKIYVPNSGSNDVTVIDGLNGNAPTRVIAGQGPFAVAVNTVTNKAYVTNSTSNNVTVIDGVTNSTSTITAGTAPKGLVINEVTNTIVVANQGSSNVTVINGDTNATTTVPAGLRPVAVGVNPTENNFYVVNQGDSNVTVIDGDTLQRIDLISLIGGSPGAVVVDPLTNRIYVANQSTNNVSVIDGGAGTVIATVPTGQLPYALDINPLINKIYVANQNDASVTVIDGTGDTVSDTLPTGSQPSGVAVNPVTNQVYVSNRGSANVTVITVGAQQPVPLNIALTPVISDNDSFTSAGVFSTFKETPSFNVTVTSAYNSSPPYVGIGTATNPPPTQVYFSVDGATPWSLATRTSPGSANPANFTITLSPLDSGLHTLYVFASYGNAGGHNTSGSGAGNSPEISNLQRLPLLVLPNVTTTALVSDAPNGAQEGTRVTFTATVTESGNPVTEGLVQFFQDGRTRGLPVQVNSSGVAIDTDNSLTSGSHTIQALYLGTDNFVQSSASVTQIIYGLPTSITVSSGSNQSAAVNTNYASPLVAVVKDAVGDPVPNITVTWAVVGKTAGGEVSAPTSTTDINGLASITVTANGNAGPFQVTASAVGPPAQFTLTNTAGAPTSIATSGGSSPQTAVINTQFNQPLTVLVTDAGSNPVQGVTVTYVANGTTANATLSAASAVTDIDGLAHVIATANGTTGSYTVTAAAGSVGSVNLALRNSTAATSTSLAPPTQAAIYGNTINFTATVDQTTATGSVDFFLGAELLGVATINAGSATLALNQIPGTGQYLPVGTHSNITATYTGDTNFGGSTSAPVTATVTKKTAAGGGPALTVVANSVTKPFGDPNPPFSYSVQGTLVSGDTTANAVTGTPVYTTSAVQSSLVGTYPLTVSGLVSANYEIAIQNGTVTVTQGNSTTTIATASTTIMYGDQEVLTAAVTEGATGTVSFYEGSTLLGTASLDSATQAELPVDNLPVGTHTITATFNGGPNSLPSTSSPATVTVIQRTGDGETPALTIVVRNATRPAHGEFAVFTYYVTGQLFNHDTYETALTGTPFLSSPALFDPGTYPINVSGLTSNNYTLTSVPGTLLVTDDAIGKPSTTTLTVNPSSGQYGDPITLTATMSPAVVSGRVTFYDVLPSGATIFIGDATLFGGTASFVASALSAGTHSIEAAYSGDGIYSTSLSLPSTVTVAKKQGPSGGAALTITVQNASRQFGTANPQFAYIVTGTLVSGDRYDSAVTSVPVYATTDTASSAVSTTYPITVSGLVSQNYEIATVPGTLTIVAAPSTTTLITAAPAPRGFTATQYGDTLTLTATVAMTTATGTVVFFEGPNVLGTAEIGSGTGVATLALSTLRAGRHTVAAMYLGDNNLSASTSTPVTIVVSPKSGPSGEPYLIVTPNDTSRIYGQANPAFTYGVSGTLVNGETPFTAVTGVPIYSTSASLGSPTGTYPVSIAGGLSSLNYLMGFRDGIVTVTPTTLTVALASSLNPATYSSLVIFTANLPFDATGTVTFQDGTTTLGTESVSGGVATQLAGSLTVGTHSITAHYEGDINYGAADSAPVAQVVDKATPDIALTSSLNPSTFGASVTFTATLPIDATGTVTFLDGATSIGTGTISSRVATLATSSLAGGTHSIIAQYGGDSNYNSSNSTPVSQDVTKATSTVALASSLPSSTFGASVTFTATVTSGATGTVTFLDGATTLGTGTISSGIATLATTTLSVGTHSITAQYGGDANYNSSTSTPVSQDVTKASSTVALVSSPNPSTFGASVTLTATVTSGTTGTVTFLEGATTLGTGTISNGIATLTTSSLTGGPHTLTAQYSGDSNYNGSTSTALTQTVNPATSTVALVSSLNPSTFGAGVTLTATVTSGTTGTVTFHDSATVLGTGTISNGVAALTTSSLTGGPHTITAQYGGDSNYNGSTSTALTQTVNQATSTVALVSSPNPSIFGASVTLTATVTSGATGTVTFHDSATVLGTGTISNGVAALTTSSLGGGTHSITAQYDGDSNYNGSTSTALTQTVNPATSTVALVSSLNPSTFGASVTLTATVTSGATGTVTFHDGATVLGTGTISNGVAALTTSSLTGGTHSITAQYEGEANYNPAASSPVSQVVNLASSTVTLSSSLNPSTFGASVIFTATVTSGATGTVTFHDGATALGTGTISNGIATLTTSSLAVGTHSITAQYGGDTNYNSSTSAPVSQDVTKASSTVALVSSLNPSTFGASVTLTATVTSGVTGTVTFLEAATILGTGTVSNGIATLTTSSLTGGPHTITAQYGGDANYNGSTSTALTQTVNPATSTVALASSLNPSTFGASVIFTATVTSGATGTVTFLDGATSLGTGTIGSVAPGEAALTISSLAGGTHSITAQYGGDSNYSGAVSTAVSQVVTQAAATTTLVVSPSTSPLPAKTMVTLTATVLSGATPVHPGLVTFCDATAPAQCKDLAVVGTAQLTTAGTAVLKFVPGSGSHNFLAVFAGTTAYATSSSTAQALTVSPPPPPYATVAAITSSGSAGNYTLTTTVTATGITTPTLTGTVSFLDTTNSNSVLGSSPLGSVTLTSNFANASGSPVPAGIGPGVVTRADFNGDGIADLAVANSISDSARVLLGDGSGGFAPAPGSPFAVGTGPGGIATGDFNGDGIVDLAVTNSSSNNVSILLGDGSGAFAPAAGSPIAVGFLPSGVARADFNGDGIADLAVANSASDNVSILLGDGSGGFAPAPASPVAVGSGPGGLVVGDFNGDGIADLAVTNTSANNVRILLGDGSGGFAPAPGLPVAVGSLPTPVATGDFNRDGIADLAVANVGDGNVTTLLGDGSGRFAPAPGSPIAVGSSPRAVSVGYFNGDGIVDLAVTNANDDNVSILLGDGSGGFVPGSPVVGVDIPYGLATGDFNGDGIADLAVANNGGSSVSILLNQSTQTATAQLTGVNIVGSGTHDVNASYPGDTSFSSSISPTIPLTAAQVATTLALTASPTTITFGQQVVLTATLSPSSTGSITTDGQTVSFLNGGTSLGTGTLASGVATLNVTTLPVGTNSLTAVYAGDTNFVASTSPPTSFVVTQVTPVITWANPAAITYGTPLSGTQLNATASVPGTFAYTPAAEAVLNAGTQTLNVTFTPTDTTNYTTATASVSLVVNKAVLTVTATDASRIYGAANPAFTSTITGFVNGESQGSVVTGAPDLSTAATSSSAAGTYPITAAPGTLAATNYTFTFVNGTLTVDKAVLSVTANDAGRTYGAANPAFTSTIAGFVNGDTQASAVTGAPDLTTVATTASPAGTYPITAVQGTLAATNYTFTFVNGTLTVNKAVLTVTANDASRAYGVANPAFTSTITGFVNGESQASAVTGAPDLTTAATTTSSAGTYPITAVLGTLAATNYTFTLVNGTLTVSKAVLTVTATDASRIYGVANPAFASTITGFVNGDTQASAVTGAPDLTTAATTTSPVGIYPITAVQGTLAATNYTFTFVNGTLTVNKGTPGSDGLAAVTVSLSPNPSNYGSSVTFTATVPVGATGTVTFEDNGAAIGGALPISGSTASFTISTLVAGTHPIIAVYSGDINYNGAPSSVVTHAVNKVTLTVTANDASRAYGVENPAFTSTITGFVNGDSQASVVTGAPSLTTTATTVSPAGTYPINAVLGTLAATNYTFTFVNGTLTVTPAVGETTLSVNPTTVMYGNPAVLTAVVGPTPGATGTVSFHDGTTPLGTSSLDSSATAVLPVSTLNAGAHTITATYNGDSNFPPSTSTPVTLTVTQRTGTGPNGASLTVTVNNATRTTTEANPPFSHTVAGDLVNGDTTATAVTGTPTYSTTAGTTAGTFAITVSGLASQNYVLASVPGTLTVVPSSSSTTLAASPNSSQYGDPVTLTATVTPGATGTASFYDSLVYLGQGTVTGGVATLSTTTLNVGAHTITATYNGDATYASSMSGPAAVTVVKNTAPGSSLTVTVLNESRAYGTANPEFSYIVSGTLLNGDTYETAVTGVPVYSVADSPNSPVGSTFPINVSGLVSQNYTLTTVPGTLTVVTAATTTTLTIATTTTSQTRSVTLQYGDPATLTATVTPSSATGTVVFSVGSTVIGTAPVSGGIATLTTSAQSTGTKTITTSYQGDANHAASTSSPVTAIVTPRTDPGGGAALTVTVANASRQYGQGNPAFSYTVSGTLINGDTYATAVTGVPVFSTTATATSPVGTYPISITGGVSSANYSLAFVNGTLTVSKGTPSVTLASSQNPSTPATSVTFTATLSAGATGTVTFRDGTTVMGTGTVSSGTASLSTSTLSAGTHSITAQYGGDTNYNSSTSAPVSQDVTKASSTVALVSSLNPSTFGASVTLTATVTSGTTGTVTFLEGATTIGTGTISSGLATLRISSLAVGTHSITAQYGGNANYNTSSSTPVSQDVTKASSTVALVSSLNPSTFGANVIFTATVPAGATGTVQFFDGTTVLGPGTVSNGTASFSTSTLSAGTHSITAGYSGDRNYNGATSSALSQTVNKITATVTLTSSRNPVPSGSPLTFTATVPAGATGTVQFLDGTTVLGPGTVFGGTANFSTTTLSVGTHSITAAYSGDGTYNGATSSAVSQVVQTIGGPQPTFTVTSTTGPQLIPPGASASYSITVTPVNGAFNNVVTLTATNLPPGSSYTFTPTTLTPGSAGATSTFTVTVPKQSGALRHVSKTPFALAVLLLPLAFLRRTRARPPRLLLWLLLGLTSFGALSGCGSGGYFNQPQQTYTITITATSGDLSNSGTVTLTVQ